MLTVLFFAQLRERLGTDKLIIEMPAESWTVADLTKHLVDQYPEWQKSLLASNIITAVNQQVADKAQALKSGDEIAYFPPVTGG